MDKFDGPFRLSRGAHKPGTYKACAMNMIAWEQGEPVITDMPARVAPGLAIMMHTVNDRHCTHTEGIDASLLCPTCSVQVLDVAHRTVGTAVPADQSASAHQAWATAVVDWAWSLVCPPFPSNPTPYVQTVSAASLWEAWGKLRDLREVCAALDTLVDPSPPGWLVPGSNAMERKAASAAVEAVNLVARAGLGWSLAAAADHAVTEWHALTGTTPVGVPAEVTERAVERIRAAAPTFDAVQFGAQCSCPMCTPTPKSVFAMYPQFTAAVSIPIPLYS